MSSSVEAKVGALLHNSKAGESIRVNPEEMGHPQQATPTQTDNSTENGIINDNIQQKRIKAMDMRLYWVQDRIRQGRYNTFWKQEQLI